MARKTLSLLCLLSQLGCATPDIKGESPYLANSTTKVPRLLSDDELQETARSKAHDASPLLTAIAANLRKKAGDLRTK